LKTPDKLDKHIMEKFKRDKSETTNGVAILDEEISKLAFLLIF